MVERLKVVFLDAEGTFLKFHPALGEIYKELWNRHGVHIDPDTIERALRSVYREIFQEELQPPLNGDICKEAWRQVFERVFVDLKNHPNFEAVFIEAFNFFAQPDCVEVLPGFTEFIRIIKSRGLKCAIISNWDCRLYSVLNGHGLLHYFDGVFLGCEVGYLKPDLRIFQIALEHFKVRPYEAIMIGDSMKDDIEPAIKLNMHTLHVKGDHSFRDLLDLFLNEI